MYNNLYIVNTHRYVLGGLINAEVFGSIISCGKDTTIYDIYLNNEKIISLSKRYSLFVEVKKGKTHNYSAKDIKENDTIWGLASVKYKVKKVVCRNGGEVLIPKVFFSLDDILVSTDIEERK